MRLTITIDFKSNDGLVRIRNLLSNLKANNVRSEVVELGYRNDCGKTVLHSKEGDLRGGFDDFGSMDYLDDFDMYFPYSYWASINFNIEEEDVERIYEYLFKLK